MKHPNRISFEGVLCKIEEPSNSAPRGTRGHRLRIPAEVAEASVASIVGMAVNFSAGNGHNPYEKIGIIQRALIKDDHIYVSGFLYRQDFPGVIEQICACEDLGMSFEAADCGIEDMRSEIWAVSRMTFKGAAILPRKKVAFKSSRFWITEGGAR